METASSFPNDRFETTARALWIEAEGVCAIRSEELSPLRTGEVLVETLYSGISRGTESLVLGGHVPLSEYGRMRGPHMAGDFPFPVKYGYACVGRVRAGPHEIVGKTVFCLHPHQDRFIVDRAMITQLPEDLPAERAILAANMETALNIVWDAGVQPGDRVAVFGAGVVGALVANICGRIAATDTYLIDTNANRAQIADTIGVSFGSAGTLSGEFDVLINASASGTALEQAISHAGREARIVEASWYGDRPVSLGLGGEFHSKRLRLICSQVGAIPSHHVARWSFNRRMAKALELLRDQRLDALISGTTGFTEIAHHYPAILSAHNTLCHRISYP